MFARTSWTPDAFWGVFSSSPQVNSDHHHFSAGNFVMTRGADHLIVDPSNYGEPGTARDERPQRRLARNHGQLRPQPDALEPGRAAMGARHGRRRVRGARRLRKGLHEQQRSLGHPVRAPGLDHAARGRDRADQTACGRPTPRTGLLREPARQHERYDEVVGAVATGTVGDSKVVITAVELSGAQPTLSSPKVADATTPIPAATAPRRASPVDLYAVTILSAHGPSASTSSTGSRCPRRARSPIH